LVKVKEGKERKQTRPTQESQKILRGFFKEAKRRERFKFSWVRPEGE